MLAHKFHVHTHTYAHRHIYAHTYMRTHARKGYVICIEGKMLISIKESGQLCIYQIAERIELPSKFIDIMFKIRFQCYYAF